MKEKEKEKKEEKREEEKEKENKNKKQNISNNYIISEKLKALILLILNEEKYIKKDFNNDQAVEVFLLNNKWLIQYQYDTIKTELENINNLNIDSDINNIDNIILKLDKQILEEIDKKILSTNSHISFNAQPEKLKLLDKEINIYKDFIIVNEPLLDTLKAAFSETKIKNQNIKYFPHKIGDLFIIKNLR